MNEYTVQMLSCLIAVVVSLRYAWRDQWMTAIYFLIAAGLLAIWSELHHRGKIGTSFNHCQWYSMPNPGDNGEPNATQRNSTQPDETQRTR